MKADRHINTAVNKQSCVRVIYTPLTQTSRELVTLLDYVKLYKYGISNIAFKNKWFLMYLAHLLKLKK